MRIDAKHRITGVIVETIDVESLDDPRVQDLINRYGKWNLLVDGTSLSVIIAQSKYKIRTG